MTIDLVLKYLKDPEREYDAAEVAEGLGISEKEAHKALRSLAKPGGMLTRRKVAERGRLVYRTKQAQLWPSSVLPDEADIHPHVILERI